MYEYDVIVVGGGFAQAERAFQAYVNLRDSASAERIRRISWGLIDFGSQRS